MNKEIKIEKCVIEGLKDNGDGGRTIEGDLTEQQVCDGINKLLSNYNNVNFVPNYPRGNTYKFYKEVTLEEIKNISN